MPKYKELREAKGLQAKQVAETAGVDVTMYSRFENYRALPIPVDFEKILGALECLPTDVYKPDEVQLLPNATKVEATGGARVYQEPTEYKMTVRLGNNCRDVLTKEVLQKCGYKSINDWVIACVKRLKSQYEAIQRSEQKKAPKALRNKADGAVGARQTAKTPTDTILSNTNSFVK
ncbi:MAG: helix-turn-helix domain-containing protein [Roseburia sp.]|nr:helix-turn-helix domain-containing protein [Roseburia sp.]